MACVLLPLHPPSLSHIPSPSYLVPCCSVSLPHPHCPPASFSHDVECGQLVPPHHVNVAMLSLTLPPSALPSTLSPCLYLLSACHWMQLPLILIMSILSLHVSYDVHPLPTHHWIWLSRDTLANLIPRSSKVASHTSEVTDLFEVQSRLQTTLILQTWIPMAHLDYHHDQTHLHDAIGLTG